MAYSWDKEYIWDMTNMSYLASNAPWTHSSGDPLAGTTTNHQPITKNWNLMNLLAYQWGTTNIVAYNSNLWELANHLPSTEVVFLGVEPA